MSADEALPEGLPGGLLGELVALRRELHADPEVGLELPRTQARVVDALDGLGLEITLGVRSTSVVAVLRGAEPGPTVLLRGDMDGLPIAEATGLSFASTNGAMHACGHDLHTAALVGAARILSAQKEDLTGDVVFMFQPGEEGHGGARAMLADGVLDASGTKPVAAYALHVIADLPHGVFHGRPGPVMAAYSTMQVDVIGRGGHGGRPHEALDPIPVAAQVITAAQTYVARRFSAFDPVVLTFGEFHAGTAPNVIAEKATLRAGIRTFSAEHTARVASELPALAEQIAAASGCRAQVTFTPVMAPTINDHQAAAVFEQQATAIGSYVQLENPRTGSEDFSEVLSEVPGAFGYLGAAFPGSPSPAGNHSPRAVFDDSRLEDAARLLAGCARHHLCTAS
ncbi:M20 family metallopeptidase [Kineosporia mesophila]|uniref:M20 family metallopeptidase n=1 Tax=Kineosporia mesophila TaxID=566012 RepID=A0ABP6ZD73_9ACTN|nr:M20 family metallopeptidase [Kineosporia mesophila]MCD5350160.1 M20 family metallopeptidase [Kineosporia mesophila]